MLELQTCNGILVDAFDYSVLPGTIPAQTAGWCGTVFSADSARLSEAEQAGQVLCHLPGIKHGWRPPTRG